MAVICSTLRLSKAAAPATTAVEVEVAVLPGAGQACYRRRPTSFAAASEVMARRLRRRRATAATALQVLPLMLRQPALPPLLTAAASAAAAVWALILIYSVHGEVALLLPELYILPLAWACRPCRRRHSGCSRCGERPPIIQLAGSFGPLPLHRAAESPSLPATALRQPLRRQRLWPTPRLHLHRDLSCRLQELAAQDQLTAVRVLAAVQPLTAVHMRVLA